MHDSDALDLSEPAGRILDNFRKRIFNSTQHAPKLKILTNDLKNTDMELSVWSQATKDPNVFHGRP